MVLWQRNILPPNKPPPRRLINRPRQIRRRQHQNPTRIAPLPLLTTLLPTRRRPGQIRPLDQKLRLNPPRRLMLTTARTRRARRQQAINLIDKDDGRRERAREREQRAHQLLGLAEELGGEAGGGDGEEGGARLGGDGAREHRLARAGGPEQQQAPRGFAQAQEQVGPEERVDDGLFERGFGAVEARDVAPVHLVALHDDLVDDLLGRVGVDAAGQVLEELRDAAVFGCGFLGGGAGAAVRWVG